MPTMSELAAARDTLAILLHELGLAGHRFEISPADGDHWGVDVECSAPDGWLKVELQLPRADLLDAPHDANAKARVTELLAGRLADCRGST